jgi:hypothetical protein
MRDSHSVYRGLHTLHYFRCMAAIEEKGVPRNPANRFDADVLR